MSAPATNAFSPEPVRTIALTWSSPLHSSIARRSSSMVWEFSAFKTFGRLMVMTTIAPSRSRRRLSKFIVNPRFTTEDVQNSELGIQNSECLNSWFQFQIPNSEFQIQTVLRGSFLERKRIHQPAEHERRQQKPAEQQAAEPKLFGHTVLRNDGEYERHEEREQGEEQDMALHQQMEFGRLISCPAPHRT